MDGQIQDIWMIVKESWRPRPGWRSTGEPTRSRGVRLKNPAPPVDAGKNSRSFSAENVVELRPHARDHAYADCILSALCAACEAHAAGNDELLMARIRELYHLYDDEHMVG